MNLPSVEIKKKIYVDDIKEFIDELNSGRFFDDETAIEYIYETNTMVIKSIKMIDQDYVEIHISLAWYAKYILPDYYLDRDVRKRLGLCEFSTHKINLYLTSRRIDLESI